MGIRGGSMKIFIATRNVWDSNGMIMAVRLSLKEALDYIRVEFGKAYDDYSVANSTPNSHGQIEHEIQGAHETSEDCIAYVIECDLNLMGQTIVLGDHDIGEGRGVHMRVDGYKTCPQVEKGHGAHVYVENWDGCMQLMTWNGQEEPAVQVLKPYEEEP
jgi:hypothetical protein